LGVSLVSLGESNQGDHTSGRLQLAVPGAIAQFERARIVERVRSGLAKAKAQGQRLGRRKTALPEGLPRGLTVRSAAAQWGVSKSTAAYWSASGRLPATL
jgi:DNA invertase Pin-like site-specific DNA recombinase